MRGKRLPITPSLLQRLHAIWSKDPLIFDKAMLWAACCLDFFGFMQAGEFTCTSCENVLSVSDVTIDSRESPQVLIVHLRHKKTDPFGIGTHLYLGRTGDQTLCPVTAVLNYLAIHPPVPGPLFCFQNGTPLSRVHLVHHLQDALFQAGVDTIHYAGHSFFNRHGNSCSTGWF